MYIFKNEKNELIDHNGQLILDLSGQPQQAPQKAVLLPTTQFKGFELEVKRNGLTSDVSDNIKQSLFLNKLLKTVLTTDDNKELTHLEAYLKWLRFQEKISNLNGYVPFDLDVTESSTVLLTRIQNACTDMDTATLNQFFIEFSVMYSVSFATEVEGNDKTSPNTEGRSFDLVRFSVPLGVTDKPFTASSLGNYSFGTKINVFTSMYKAKSSGNFVFAFNASTKPLTEQEKRAILEQNQNKTV